MNITVLGAAGKTGAAVVDQALAQGHHVTALVRDRTQITRTDPGLTVVEGDARETTTLNRALTDADAVISTLGTTKAKDQLLSRTTDAVIDAAATTGTRRIVIMSSFLASPQLKPTLATKIITRLMGSVLADKTTGEARLAASDLDWTIVYPTSLDKAPAGGPVRVLTTDQTVTADNGIARADVANFLLESAATTTHSHQRVVITTN